jgi:hypothetical protein
MGKLPGQRPTKATAQAKRSRSKAELARSQAAWIKLTQMVKAGKQPVQFARPRGR